MPWKETSAMNQRVQLIADWLSGDYTKRELCQMYGISRPTTDKWLERYRTRGARGLEELSRAPHHRPNQTPEAVRSMIVECKLKHQKWGLKKISDFGEKYFVRGDKKITLNFVFSGEMEISRDVLSETFDPEKFILKITPVNPTISAVRNGINTDLRLVRDKMEVKAEELMEAGFEVIVSIGELEENRIGSNCGQYIGTYLEKHGITLPGNSYTYNLEKIV